MARAGGAPRRLLFLAFYFPPLGGGGVQRTVKFAKYLPEFGFEPVLVTGPGGGRTRHAPLDASLAGELPADLPVFRTKPLPSDAHGGRWRRWLGRPSAFEEAWMAGCEKAALEAAEASGGADLVLASMSPFGTCVPAARVAERLGVPWVADLRDPWALDEMTVYPTRWHRAHERHRMRRWLASAAAVVMNTSEAARALRGAFPELAERALVIPNGFDAADFAGEAPSRSPARFRIVHTGALHVRLGRAYRRSRWLRGLTGGERIPVDILTRSHLYLIRALEKWRREHPNEAERSELVLAGDLSPEDRAVVLDSRVADLVRMPGYLSHVESVELLRGADLLFLPMHALPPGERARIVPGKTYEYLAARRPILAAVPEGDARDLVLASGLGEVCEPGDVAAMTRSLRRQFAAHREGREPAPADAAFYAQFERRPLAARLAAALESVLRPADGRASLSAERARAFGFDG